MKHHEEHKDTRLVVSVPLVVAVIAMALALVGVSSLGAVCLVQGERILTLQASLEAATKLNNVCEKQTVRAEAKLEQYEEWLSTAAGRRQQAIGGGP